MADVGWPPSMYLFQHCPAACSAPKPAMLCNGSKGGRIDCITATVSYLIVRRQMACLTPGRYPLDMVRGRLTIQAGKGDHYSGIMHATRSIIRDVRHLPLVSCSLSSLSLASC